MPWWAVHAKCCPGRWPIQSRFCDGVVVRGNLTAAGYIEQILLQYVLVAAYSVGPEFVLMHNNSMAHVACIIRAVLQELNIQEMEWPAVSSDLNSIKHMWDRPNRSVCGHPVPPHSLRPRTGSYIVECNLILESDLRQLIQSKPRRWQAVINAHGGHRPY